MNFTPPEHLRKGQSIINFLQWIAIEKEDQIRTLIAYMGNQPDRNADAHIHLADIFYVSDAKLEAWWQEYLDDADFRRTKG